MANFVTSKIFDNNGISVHVIKSAPEDSVEPSLDDAQVPASKCYRNTRFVKRYFAAMEPIFTVSDITRYYDFNHKVAALHGSCISDINNQAVTPLQFKEQNPDLAFCLALDQLKLYQNNIPVLSLHFEHEQLTKAQLNAVENFCQSLISWPSDNNFYYMLIEHYHAKCMLGGLHLQKGNHVILLDALIDELGIAWSNIVTSIVAQLQGNVLEDYARRNAVIGNTVTQWVDASSYKRISVRRCPDLADLFCSSLKMKLFDKITQHLDKTILEVIQNAK